MDYKTTLNLPKTEFSMKANLKEKEPKMLDFWKNNKIYEKIQAKYANAKKYILHDGPPYANGNIHIGHALNKILKDMIIKYKTLHGFSAPYVPGWDCHGLPVEHQLFKELKINKSQIDKIEFRKKAKDYALRYVTIQKEEFKRLGVFGEWDNPYLTLAHDYEYAIIKSFGELAKKGYIYRGLKPVNWCYSCETALAEAEVEYQDKTSPSIFVKFEIINPEEISANLKNKKAYFLIWTTTPWTLLANVAVALHPDFEYVGLVQDNNDILIVARDLVEKIKTIFDDKSPAYRQAGKIINYDNPIKFGFGKDLIKAKYLRPFNFSNKEEGCVVNVDYVTKEEGTGCVHTAPGHGADDYLAGLKYNLPILMPVDEKGKFDSKQGEFVGLHVNKANEKIIEFLKNKTSLIFEDKIRHSYPHCWRCKEPIIFRATSQWFMNVDHNNLRGKVLNKIKEISWVPTYGERRLSSMIEGRPDWCLSRQRYWGVPIPVIYCKTCADLEILNLDVIENYTKLILEEGSDAWFTHKIEDFLPKDFVCPECRKRDSLYKGEDILDVWFDSGVSSQAVLKQRKNLTIPADIYLEGSDQHRGWFQASIIPSMAIDEAPCFKEVLTHGFVVDGQGFKMSKSQGNVISPQQVIDKYGADILRLWVASSDYSEDIRISDEILLRLAEGYRKIRNTFRFIISNLYDFNFEKDKVEYEKLFEIDKWLLLQLNSLIKELEYSFDKFLFFKAYQEIHRFCTEVLSNFYLDILKDRLYTFKSYSNGRRSAQTVLFNVLEVLIKLSSPIVSFTAEEIWQVFNSLNEEALPSQSDAARPRSPLGERESIFLSTWPKVQNEWENKALESNWQRIIEIRKEVLKALEEKRVSGIIGSSLEASIEVKLCQSDYDFLNKYSCEQLKEIFIVSCVELISAEKFECIVTKAQGQKCIRCWNYSLTVGQDSTHSEICARCMDAIK